MGLLTAFIRILIFPGFLFLSAYALVLQFLDRKLYARLQSRQGPPWYQPVADFFKLLGKETLIPAQANHLMFRMIPAFCLGAMAAAFIYIPVWGRSAMFSFEGDMIVVLYFLAIPPLASFLAGWYSRSLFATVGATRTLTQMFAYEVPMFLALLAPTLLSGSWSISGNTAFYAAHPLLVLVNLPALVVTLIVSQCKLERTPFDAPEAETEIVSGPLVEYGGRYLAFFTFSKDCELVVVLSLFTAMFLPFSTGIAGADFLLYIVKTLAVMAVLCLLRATTARLRINQIVSFCWKYLAPAAMFQIILNLILREVFSL
ncbi:NADH-quinone oxidoreductase subunit H [Oscillospiraceae bacterium HV4-5-C5C]|nr:NADH-quinone oxidoreductase subunit H [Oscillospiraceae bacterium HV4-5-C5C]